MVGVLCVDELSTITCTSSPSGTLLSMRARKRRNSSARCRCVRSLITSPEATSRAA